MSTYDNAPPPADWKPEPRRSPFDDAIYESPQHGAFMRGCDKAIADIGPEDRDPLGTE